MNNIRTCKREE